MVRYLGKIAIIGATAPSFPTGPTARALSSPSGEGAQLPPLAPATAQLTAATSALDKAKLQVGRASSERDLDRSLADTKSVVEAALKAGLPPNKEQSLRARLKDLENKIAHRKQELAAEEQDSLREIPSTLSGTGSLIDTARARLTAFLASDDGQRHQHALRTTGILIHAESGRGHTFSKHLGLDLEQLAHRMTLNPEVRNNGASSYLDPAEAANVISSLLSEHASDIEAWSSDPLTRTKEVHGRADHVIGVHQAWDGNTTLCTDFRVILSKSSDDDQYTILTSFPELDQAADTA